LVTFAFALLALVAAQINTGELSGVVRDSSGGVLPRASVTATHPTSGIVVERLTDEAGRYFLPALRVGAWRVEARMSGLAPQTQQIVLEVGRSLTLDFALSIQGVTEQVDVQLTLPLLQFTTAEISDVIENREVVQLPLNGRSFITLAQLSDSVVIPPGGTRGEALQQAGPLPNVGGQRSGHNIYLLDGVKVTDELFNNLVRAVCQQPDSCVAPRSDCDRPAAIGAAADVGHEHPEPHGRRRAKPRAQSIQRAARPPVDDVRSAVCPVQHLRRRRDAALRHEHAAGIAGARLWPLAEYAHAESGRDPYARLRHLNPERIARRG
jgi:hypothetical protein